MKRAVCILINSKTKDSLPTVENTETWDSFVRVVLVDDFGREEWQYIPVEKIEKMKIEDAMPFPPYNIPKVKSVAQFIEQKFGKIFVAHNDAVPNALNTYLDEIAKGKTKIDK